MIVAAQPCTRTRARVDHASVVDDDEITRMHQLRELREPQVLEAFAVHVQQPTTRALHRGDLRDQLDR